MLFHNQIYFYFYTGYSYQISSKSNKQGKLMQTFLFQPTGMNDKPKLNQTLRQILEKQIVNVGLESTLAAQTD